MRAYLVEVAFQMIITKEDVATLEKALTHEWENGPLRESLGESGFLLAHPHFALCLGFDEYHFVPRERVRYEEFGPFKKWPVGSIYGIPATEFSEDVNTIYRDEATGVWWSFWPGQIFGISRVFHLATDGDYREVYEEEWLAAIRAAAQTPDARSKAIWLPGAYSASTGYDLARHVRPTIEAINSGHESLRDVKPRVLEEMVAELLRSRGFSIHLTKSTRDGGRDVIARGELVPGEPIEIAVEVKQADVVGIGDVQRALKANEFYPALMLVTAGRFSAGVVATKRDRQHQMRLFLKDGLAVSHWLKAYDCAP